MTKFCRRCSKALSENEAFCTLCGERQTDAPQQAYSQQPGHAPATDSIFTGHPPAANNMHAVHAPHTESIFSGQAPRTESVFSGHEPRTESIFSGKAPHTESVFPGQAHHTESVFPGQAPHTEGVFPGHAPPTDYVNPVYQHQQPPPPAYPHQNYPQQTPNMAKGFWSTEKIIALIAAIVVVLAGAGTAVYFVFFHDQGETPIGRPDDGALIDDGYDRWDPRPPDPLPPSPPMPAVDVQAVTIIHANQEIIDFTLRLGDAPVPMNVRIAPAGYREEITWSSSNEGVVEVIPSNAQGTTAEIRAIGVGSAEVTVRAGGITQTCVVRVTDIQEPEPVPVPEPVPDLPISQIMYQIITETDDWVSLTAYWPDWSGNRPTVFTRDKGSLVWTMNGRDGSFRIVDPYFSYRNGALVIGFPTTSSEYLIYDNETGVFGSSNERLTWRFESDRSYSAGSDWGTEQTGNLRSAISNHQLITIRVFWSNGQFAIFYRDADGRWMMRGRNGGFTSVSPSFSYQSGGSATMSFSGSSDRYSLNDGGRGSFGNESITWSYCYYNR